MERRRRANQRGEESSIVTLGDLKIRTKNRLVIPLVPNPMQAGYLDAILPEWRQGDITMNGIRENILKARQFGFSTLILALLFLDTVNRANTYTVVVAHDADSTERLFQAVKLFYERLPAHKRPRTKYANRREYVWPDLNSSFFVGQAGSANFGRSSTINNVLATEVAFWPDPESLFSSLLQAVPANGSVFSESTANGYGTWHHQEYLRCKDGESSFNFSFHAWFQNPEYTSPARDDFDEATERLSERERQREHSLAERHGVTREQLQWRRDKMRDPGMIGKFAQEYPASDTEAFLHSGRAVFDGEWLEAQEIHEATPIPGGKLPKALQAIPDLAVYALPVKGRRYVIGADTSEGLAHGDYSAAVVIDRDSWEEAASYHGHPEPDHFGIHLDALARAYDSALLAVERNNHGLTTLTKLKDLKTPRLYHAEDGRRGWVTDQKTKPVLIDSLTVALRDEQVKIRSAVARGQMSAYKVLDSGRYGAPSGGHDDFVMAWAIAVQASKKRGGFYSL